MGGPTDRRDDALRWPLPQDDGQREAMPSSPGVDLVPFEDDWELDLLAFTAPRPEERRVGARLLSFVVLGLAVAVTGWMNVAGFWAPDAASHPVKAAVMWAFALTGTLLVIVSLILLVLAMIEAWPWSRRRRGGAF